MHGRFSKGPPPNERKNAIRKTHELFGKAAFSFFIWKNLMDAYMSHSLWKTALSKAAGRTWLYISGLSAPPQEEVSAVMDEIEEEYEEANRKFSAPVLWATILTEAEKRWPSPMWKASEPRCSDFTWTDKVFGFKCAAFATTPKVYWVEAAAQELLRQVTGYPDAVALVRTNPETNRKCPRCGKKMLLKMAAKGFRFLSCEGYRSTPKCEFTDKWPSRHEAFEEMKFKLGQRTLPIGR